MSSVTDNVVNDEAAFAATVQARLLDRDPLASADFCEHYLPLLTRVLKSRYRTTDPELIEDAVVETLLAHVERPERFDPARRSLLGYLKMAAEGDLKNLLARHKTRHAREVILEPVELDAAARNTTVARDDDLADDVVERDAAVRQAARIMAVAQSEEERRVLRLMMDGEKATDEFAAALGLTALSQAEQRQRVYAIKDRLTKRLRRQGRGNDD